jgi:hypothetical protein
MTTTTARGTTPVPEAAALLVVGVAAGGGMADARKVSARTHVTPTRHSWKPNHTRSILATGMPTALTPGAHGRARPTCPPAPHGPAPSAACRARPVRPVRRARRREIQPPPTTAPGSLLREPRPAQGALGRRPEPGPARRALVPGSRGHLVFAPVRDPPVSRTIPPSLETPRYLMLARHALSRLATDARKRARPAARSMHGGRDKGPSSPMPRAAIRTGPHRQAGNSTAGRSAAAQ